MEPVTYSPVLAALPADELDHHLERSTVCRLQPDEILFICDEVVDRIYLVTDGTLKHTVCRPGSSETIVALSVEGDLVGDMGALLDGVHPFDTHAATECSLIGFDAESLMRSIEVHPKACLALATTLAARTRWMANAAFDRSSMRVPARLAGRLLDLAELVGRMNKGTMELELPLAQTDLGKLAGISRESVCKTLRKFRSAGVVDYEGRKLRILRPDVLRHLTCEGRVAKPFR